MPIMQEQWWIRVIQMIKKLSRLEKFLRLKSSAMISWWKTWNPSRMKAAQQVLPWERSEGQILGEGSRQSNCEIPYLSRRRLHDILPTIRIEKVT